MTNNYYLKKLTKKSFENKRARFQNSSEEEKERSVNMVDFFFFFFFKLELRIALGYSTFDRCQYPFLS